MRIVAGRLKARQLTLPKNTDIRPTTDKLRSAIFSILSDTALDANVIDIFAGSGALGIEAVSRGASSVTFIDKDLNAVKSNIELIKDTPYKMIKKDFFKLEKIEDRAYDIIFIDPPYSQYSSEDILDAVDKKIVLNLDAVIVYEEFYKTSFTVISCFEISDERRFGDTTVRFIRRKI